MFLDGDNTLSILPSLFDKLMEVGDETREDKPGSSVAVARSWGQKHRRYSDSTPGTYGFSASWANFSRFSVIVSGLSGHCAHRQFPALVMSSSKHTYRQIWIWWRDPIVLGAVGGFALRHVLSVVVVVLTRRGSYVNGILWNYGSCGQLGIGRMSLEGRQLPIL